MRNVSHSCPAGLSAVVCACSGLCVSFCLWPYRTGFLAFFVLIPFIIFSGIRDGRGRFLLNSFVFGMGYFMGSLYWIAMLEREQITVPWLRLPAAIVLCLYLSIFMLITGYVTRRLIRLRIPYEIALAISWWAIEYLRSLGPLGFPWVSIGYSQTPYVPLIQQASVIGLYGLSAWVVLINGLLSRFIASRRVVFLAVAVAAFGGPVLWGLTTLSRSGSEGSARLSLIQPNISGNVKWDQGFADGTMQLLGEMTADSRGSDMVVWPETAVPFHLKHSPRSLDDVIALAEDLEMALLLGFPDYEEQDEQYRFFNSALLVTPSSGRLAEYRKIHLVPFGEMIPFEDKIEILRRIDLGEGDFSPGDEYTVFELDTLKFAVAICFESIYPDLVRGFVEHGAGFIVNITNDEWFGASLGPFQHAQMAVMRAVEFRVGLARCANTGISMFVDPYGRITSKTDIFERQILTGDVVAGRGGTLYLKAGKYLETGVLVGVLVLALLSHSLSVVRTRRLRGLTPG
ncbi:MAG: apolipoprotein N-acyltransferase [Candidatus Eisenbacteria bacterium]